MVGEEAADDIATVLCHNTKLQGIDLGNNNFKTTGMMKIAKSLQNISSLLVFSISNNIVGEAAAADDIATVLCHNTKLQGIDLGNNNFKTTGMMKIAKSLQNISSLIVFSISNNMVGEEAADDIATVLCHNTKLQGIDLGNNNFKTTGMMKIAKSLQNISSLLVFSISNNIVGEAAAADDIATVLCHNTKLQGIDLGNNNFKTTDMMKIAKSLQNISSLTVFNISNNMVGEEAADDIAAVLSHNTKLQTLDLQNNLFRTVGMIKIAKALKNGCYA